MQQRFYFGLLRIAAVIVAVVLWVISVQFSIDGFAFEFGDMRWAGIALAASVTVIQLVWNREGLSGNLTILVVGVGSYLYGIYTNVIGIQLAQGVTTSLSENPMQLIFPMILGIFLEITPESLLVWGLTGLATLGDPVTVLVGSLSGGVPRHKNRQTRPQSKSKSKYHPGSSYGQYDPYD